MSKLTTISTIGMSRQDWLNQRQFGLGGSDIGAILGIDKFKPAIKLFHQKIGLWETDEDDNIAAYAGRVSEEHIYNNYWKYWNPNTHEVDDMLDNANNNRVMRKAKRRNAIIVNPKYNWIRANIDYEINKQGKTPKGILELKTGNASYWRQYEAEIPTTYIWQVQCYMLVMGYEYSEIFALLDGRYPNIYPIEANKVMQDKIIDATHDFWSNVILAKEIVNSNIPLSEKLMLIAEYEPDVESTEAYETYMKDRYKTLSAEKSVRSDSELEFQRVKYRTAHNSITEFEKEKLSAGNYIRSFMVSNNVNEIVMDDKKKITWFNNRLTIPKLEEE